MRLFFWLVLTANLIAGCSGQAPATPPVHLSVVVTITPVTSTITTLQTQKFTAALTNASNTAVTWKVDDVEGGNADVGTISAAGLYTPSAQAATRNISATSVEDPTKTARATLTVKLEVIPVAITLSVTPVMASINTRQTQQFTATLTNATNTAVVWKVDGVDGGNADVGTITAAGLYTPSAQTTTRIISATSVEDPAKTATATLTIQLDVIPVAITLSVMPVTASINIIQTQQFTATVTNATNTAVTWKVDGVDGGNAAVGTITAAGLYTPSAQAATRIISATSVEDPTKTASATITIQLEGVPIAITLSITPVTASINTLQTQQFTATLTNATNPAVTWKVDDVEGGNADVGVISAAGLYTPSPQAATRVISATSVEDPTKTASATITIQLGGVPGALTISVTPVTPSINTLQTQQFTATLTNASNTAVTWKVDGVPGGNVDVGVISAAGLYTPPAREVTVSITAGSVQDPTKSSSVNATVTYLKGVFTYHTDNARTGQNLKETVLTPSNVNTAAFGKLFSLPVDGTVYAQPLYAENVPIAGQLHNVVFVATEHNSVYAFDADNATGVALWQTSFIDAARGITTVPSTDTDCEDINPEIGITSTPVIDRVTGTLYVVAMTKEINTYVHRIHALDITTGAKKSFSGIKVEASVPGTAEPNVEGRVVFTSLLENQRTALLLNNNVIYFSTGSFCDLGDHHGWLFAYDSKTLELLSAFNATPNGTEGGIWQSGGGAAADDNDNIFVISADGTFDANTGGTNYGSSFLKFAGASLTVTDYFTPYNQAILEAVNGDLGSGGALLLPDQATGPARLLVSAGKQGTIYVLNRDNMGQFQAADDSQIVQSIPGTFSLFGTPAYYKNTVYMAASGDNLKAYTLNAGQLSLAQQSPSIFRWPGATAVISANESMNGIVWALETNGSGAPALLHAYEAANITNELYNSNQNAVRDVPGPAVKFAVPIVVNGKVYVGANGQVSVFGLLP